MASSLHTITTELGLDPSIYHNPAHFIATVREGISGQVLRRALDQLGSELIFAQAFRTDSAGLESYCTDTPLDRQRSEVLLDTIRILDRVRRTWESNELAQQWLHSNVPALGGAKPVEMFDTYEGRRWVTQVAEKVERGDFS